MTSSNTVPVAKGDIVTFEQGAQIRCESGSLWITQDNDVRDVVLNAGERFVADRPGVVVFALQPSTLTASSAARPLSAWSAIVARLVRAFAPQHRLAMS